MNKMLPLLPVALLSGVIHMPKFVEARFCEGGHICSLPRECCTQGCCPPYQSGPRQLPPPSEHVLNLFFISHWFFWCVVVAIILAILCAYSLWKKRRTLCGWSFPEHHAQSEGDSAGSCYAPPQYSRCNSFHHPPPPYTEVTSKPDLYPLVFTCNSDNGKNGSSYLMVQYFRNYIVRPAGSLSAASTVDSLSSSFICNINEANTLVPPPYSRAASPEIGFSSPFQQQYMMPRSASQLVCATGGTANGGATNGVGGQVDLAGNIATQQVYQGHQGRTPHYTVVAVNGAIGAVGGAVHTAGVGSGSNPLPASPYSTHLRPSDSEHFQHNDDSGDSCRSGCGSYSGGSGSGSASGNANGFGGALRERDCDGRVSNANTGFIQSHSDQHFRYMANSNSSISDIFVNNSCCAATGGSALGAATNASGSRSANDMDSSSVSAATAFAALPHAGGTPVIFSNGCIKPNPLHRASTNPTQFVDAAATPHREPIYNSCNSIAGISLTVPPPSAERTETEFRDLHMLRRSLETCCQMLQQQQQQKLDQKLPSASFTGGADSPLRLNELAKKYADEGLPSYVTSGTCSGVSSLANIGTPSSPPQATSPTGEVKEILDQIRQLQEGVSYEDMMLHMRPTVRHTLSSPTSALVHSKFPSIEPRSPLQQQTQIIQLTSPTNSCAAAATIRLTANANPMGTTTTITTTATATQKPTNSNASNKTTGNAASKRPSTLQQSRKKFHTPKPNKAMYIPMTANPTMPSNRCILKSPVSSVVSANFFATRGRVRKIWVSRSAPTTPGTALPPNRLGDDSPLLTEHDEDQEGEQNEEMD